MNTSSKPIPAAKMSINTSVAKQSFAPPGGFNMWRLFKRSSISETERVRGGGGPLDNLIVLMTSLALLVILGVGLLWYFGYWPGGHPTLTEHG